jgi:hypothetical protein
MRGFGWEGMFILLVCNFGRTKLQRSTSQKRGLPCIAAGDAGYQKVSNVVVEDATEDEKLAA